MDYNSLLQARHAVHVAGGRIVCGYAPKPDDVREPDQDWMTAVHAAQRCSKCARELGVEGYLDPEAPLL